MSTPQLRTACLLGTLAALVFGSARCALERMEVKKDHQPADAGSDACQPKSCADLDFVCGPAKDGCGGELECGACTFGACISGSCDLPAACTNGTKDDGEVDLDCGGSCPACGCARESWQPLSTDGAPAARRAAYSAWTGRELLVWGGETEDAVLGSGARFEPRTGKWSPMSTQGAPPPRGDAGGGVWTGRELLIWGGHADQNAYGDGASYDPATDAWSSISTQGAPGARHGFVRAWTGRELLVWGGSDAAGPLGDGFRYDPRTNQWATLPSQGAPSPRLAAASAWTGRELIIWGGESGGVVLGDGARFDPSAGTWSAITKTGAPSARRSAHATWTGRELLLVGGESGIGGAEGSAAYDPEADVWRALPNAQSPSARSDAAAVWTGRELIVWGGSSGGNPRGDGARYDAKRDTWTMPTPKQAPSPRAGAVAAWTGRELIVWGGSAAKGMLADGGRYTPPADPGCDQWASMSTKGALSPRSGHRAAWTGREAIFVGGTESSGCSGVTDTGGSYAPDTDAWSPLPPVGEEFKRQVLIMAFTGREVIAWGGTNKGCSGFHTGAAFDVRTRAWSSIPETDAPIAGDQAANYSSASAFTGRELALFAPTDWTEADHHLYFYDREKKSWTFADPEGEPAQRNGASLVWTGREVIVWGGNRDVVYPDGHRFDVVGKKWTPVSASGAPSKRTRHAALWTGREMIVWGGIGDPADVKNTILGDGARYEPRTDSWQPLSSTGAPPGRHAHVAIWTGREMIVWGGLGKDGVLDDGARYDPEADRWWPMAKPEGPPRAEFPALWTGREILVWGGSADSGLIGTGVKYVP